MVKKTMSAAMLTANRANGRKSRGPVTERGKSIVPYNAATHWGRAEMMRGLMPALDEHAEDFDRLRTGLYDSLQPQDAFEALLVDDMADIHWHLRRMLRGQTGMLAKQRRQEKARLEQLEAASDSGRLAKLEPAVAKLAGFVTLEDSAAKFNIILERLNIVGLQVQEEGFTEQGLPILKHIYGLHPGSRADTLMGIYENGVKAKKTGDAGRDRDCQEGFQELLRREMVWFRERAASERQARDELRAPRIEAAMLEGKFDPVKAIFYQEGMERRFERKWKLLMKYRTRRRALEKSVEAEAIVVEDEDAIEVETEDGNQLAEAAAGS